MRHQALNTFGCLVKFWTLRLQCRKFKFFKLSLDFILQQQIHFFTQVLKVFATPDNVHNFDRTSIDGSQAFCFFVRPAKSKNYFTQLLQRGITNLSHSLNWTFTPVWACKEDKKLPLMTWWQLVGISKIWHS